MGTLANKYQDFEGRLEKIEEEIRLKENSYKFNLEARNHLGSQFKNDEDSGRYDRYSEDGKKIIQNHKETLYKKDDELNALKIKIRALEHERDSLREEFAQFKNTLPESVKQIESEIAATEKEVVKAQEEYDNQFKMHQKLLSEQQEHILMHNKPSKNISERLTLLYDRGVCSAKEKRDQAIERLNGLKKERAAHLDKESTKPSDKPSSSPGFMSSLRRAFHDAVSKKPATDKQPANASGTVARTQTRENTKAPLRGGKK